MDRSNPIRIARLCRCRVCRDAFEDACSDRPEFTLVGNYSELAENLEQLKRLDPAVILLDVDLSGGVFDAAELLQQQIPSAHLIFVAPRFSDICLKQAITLGAAGFVVSSETAPQLLEHAQQVAGGEPSFSSEIAKRLYWDAANQTFRLINNTVIESMTPEQLQILRHVARGDSLKMIASKMKLSRKSVDGHKYRLMKKIGVQDRVLLSRYAIREGLIEP